MVLKERFLLGALFVVALYTTVNHAATIPTTTSSAASPASVTSTLEALTTTKSTTTTTAENASTSTAPGSTTVANVRNETEQKEANKSDSRTENARSLDLDISKYTSSDFHNKVYDLAASPDTDKFINHEISKVHTTFRTSFSAPHIHDLDDYVLTTPSAKYFDEKHKSLQDEIKQRLEIEEQIESSEDAVSAQDEPEKNNKTSINFVRYSNVLANEDAKNKTATHRNFESEKVVSYKYESVYNQSDVVPDTYNKSPVQLLSNQIENDKPVNISKRDFANAEGNSSQAEHTAGQPQSNLLPTLEATTTSEQAHQENNIYPVLLPLPLTTTTTTEPPPPITKLYEMTDENEFVTTTEFAYATQDASNEKFYEMTETASSTQGAENEATTTIHNYTTDGTSDGDDDDAIKTTITAEDPANIQPATTDNASISSTIGKINDTTDAINATTVPDVQPTTDYPSTTEETMNTTIEKVTENLTTTQVMETTTESVVNTESEITTVSEEETEVSATKEIQPLKETVTPTEIPTTTESVEITTIPIVELSTTQKIKSISTTIKNIINAIIKEHRDDDRVQATAAPSNEIKKDNSSANEQDLDDLTEEVPDDDYADVHNRKAKPIMTSDVAKTPYEINNNKTLEESSTSSSTTVDAKSETTTLEEGSLTSSEEVVDSENSGSGAVIAIVLSTVGAICLVLLAILLFVMRRRQKRFNYGQRCTPVSLDAYSMDNVSVYNSVRRKAAMRSSKRSYGNPAFDDDTSISHPLNFQALVRFAHNDEDIKAEFDEIPQVNAKMNELPDGCDMKNRYANVIPLPESRVYLTLLDDDPTSDYINANYVTGPKGARGYYIACQAPMHSTVNDYWRMIWEQQSKVVLMVTHLFENGVEKCVDYLPPSEVVDCHRLFGDFQVTLKRREVKDKYIISSLQLKNMVSNSWREVTHLWYSGWPEKGVPDEEHSLIAFLIEARSYVKLVQNTDSKDNGISSNGRGNHLDSNPVIVHCSPGTARTGTVIACDIAIREFELRRIVDIPRIVYRIRRDRASSVQTKDQYHFIYKVINLYATKLTGGALDSI